jgi:hypothetical protein
LDGLFTEDGDEEVETLPKNFCKNDDVLTMMRRKDKRLYRPTISDTALNELKKKGGIECLTISGSCSNGELSQSQ